MGHSREHGDQGYRERAPHLGRTITTTAQNTTLRPRIPPRLFACQAGTPSIACKCLFAALQAIFLFRLPPGEKCALNA